MINIDVVSENNLWSRKIKKKDFFFETMIKFFPKKYRFIGKKINLSVLLSDNKNIKKLNKNFRKKNKPTDVLSFPFEKKISIKRITYLGDIVISYEFMNKPKSLNSLEFKNKVARTFIHGFLHLLGHDHIKLKDFKKMRQEEEKIYKFVKIKSKKFA
jgi:probable rRNA maturation factor